MPLSSQPGARFPAGAIAHADLYPLDFVVCQSTDRKADSAFRIHPMLNKVPGRLLCARLDASA